MTPWLQDADVTLYHGDVLATLRELPAESVDCVVTSPPYWGLRDYGQEGQFGLEPTPEQYVERMVEVFREVRRVLAAHGTVWLNLGSSYNPGTNADRKPTTTSGPDVPASWKSRSQPVRRAASGDTPPSQSRPGAPAYGSDGKEPEGSRESGLSYRDLCDECLADFLSHRDRTIDTHPLLSLDEQQPSQTDRDSEPQGSASTSPDASLPDAQASTSLQSWRQLRGSCSRCDSRAASLSGARSSADDVRASSHMPWLNYTSRLKPKDMVPTPWMVAMALQQDGWYLRADIVWSKPNPMPESVTDRPTKAHEYVFLLSKQPRYFFDQEAVREPAEWARWGDQTVGPGSNPNGWIKPRSKESLTWEERKDAGEPLRQGLDGKRVVVQSVAERNQGRNIRSVWEIATQPYPEAHFTTFPEELARRCIAAGCPEQVCRACGKARERVVEVSRPDLAQYEHRQSAKSSAGGTQRADDGTAVLRRDGEQAAGRLSGQEWNRLTQRIEAGFTNCGCLSEGDHVAGHSAQGSQTAQDAPSEKYRPGIVLDPFIGSGTVAYVARKLGRHAIGIDLNESYLELAARRLQQQSLFAGTA